MSKHSFLNDPIYQNQRMTERDLRLVQQQWEEVMKDQAMRNTIANNILSSSSSSGNWVISKFPEPVNRPWRAPDGHYAEQNITLFVQELREAVDENHTVEWDEMCGEPCDDFYPITVIIDDVAHDVEIPGFISAAHPDAAEFQDVEVFVDGDCIEWTQAIRRVNPRKSPF